jgi:hypothetical protein
MKFSKLIVALVIALNVLFTVAVLFIFYKVGTEPTTLIGAWFGFTTIELWALAGIKKREIDEKGEKWNGRRTEALATEPEVLAGCSDCNNYDSFR